tara:strand:- start:7266 stop:7457 length:192 start_codon:yes stop_codon:yes gene_type:complete
MSDLIKAFFFECVEIMRFLSAYTFFTYKEINTIIFLIVEPSLMILFFLLWRSEKKKYKKITKI